MKEEKEKNMKANDDDVREYIDAVLSEDCDIEKSVYNCVINMMDLFLTGILNDYTDEGKDYIRKEKEDILKNSFRHGDAVCMTAGKEAFGMYCLMFGYYFGIRREKKAWIDKLIIDNYTDYAKGLEDISEKIDAELEAYHFKTDGACFSKEYSEDPAKK